jgi:hypothetical protein
MKWDDYVPFDAGVTGPLRDASRADAEAHFARLMAARADRRAQLARLAARHGVDLAAADAPARLGAWLIAAAPAASADPRWSGLVADVALWLGERMIARAPALRWELFVSHKKATGYQRPVLVGFTRVADRHYYVDVAFMVASWAELAARRRMAKPDFLATIEEVTLRDA